jgi:hypothetical protein
MRLVNTRERKHVATKWSRVTCLALLLAATQSLGCGALKDSQSRRRLTIAIRNKKYKKINKQYTKQCLMTKTTVPKDGTHRYERVITRIT